MCAKHRIKDGETPHRWRLLFVLLLVIATIWGVTYYTVRDTSKESDAQVPTVTPTSVPDAVIPTLPEPTVTAPTKRPTKQAQPLESVAFLPETVKTPALGGHSVERLPRLVQGNGIQFPAPIDFNPATYAWDDQSAKPGSSRGVVILTAHAYSSTSTALGNQLAATLRAGDVISVEGFGNIARYKIVSTKTYSLSAYSKMAVAWLNPNATPMLGLTVCADYNPTTGDWDSRVVWIAEPMK